MSKLASGYLLLAVAATTLALVSCGGGGGGNDEDPPPPPPPPGVTVGGTLSVVENLVVDSDTNDPNQSPRAGNEDFETAQALSATGQALGTVNEALAGETGPSHDAGDLVDGYRVTVAAGQIVELDFTADPEVNDVDLYVFKQIGGEQEIVGESIGTSGSECVRFSAAGEYTIGVIAYTGASLYHLRVTAPGAASSCQNATTQGAERFVPGELVVGLRAGSAGAARSAQALADGGLRVLRGAVTAGHHALLAVPADAGTRRRALSALGARSGTALERFQAGMSARAARQIDTVRYAKTLRAAGRFDRVMLNRAMKTAALVGSFPPDDPRYANQRWHYEQISLPAAMQTLTALSPQPAQRPIVAVVDTGIVADHPDLAPQLVAGYDFIQDTGSAGDGGGIDADPDDLRSPASLPSFHGTHVAGTVAAATFDGRGAAGVAPMAQVMPLRALGVNGSGSLYDIVQAISYAAGLANDAGSLPARRADVINLSLGAAGAACDSDSAEFMADVRAAGSIVVAATGNDADHASGVDAPVGYPANCAGVIAVSATGPQRALAPYANTGAQVALAAPGGDMRHSSTGTGLPDGVYSTLATFDEAGTRVPTFAVYEGTSMATPHVAGVIALMRWVHPAITPEQVDSLLAQGRLADDAGSAGRDPQFGWGIVNAAKAVQAALALRDGADPPAEGGAITAQPAGLDFGSAGTALEFSLLTSGATTETVTAVTSSHAAVAVTPVSTDGASGLGTYRVAVDRSALPAGVTTATVSIETSAARTLTIAVSVEKRSAASGGAGAGPVYVLVVDAASNEVIAQVDVQPAGGRYVWSVSGIEAAAIAVVAGSDYDNDGYVCARGEACGAYPVRGSQLSPITLSGDRDDIDFLLAPAGAANAGAEAASALRVPKRSGR